MTINWRSETALTITLAGLATSAGLVAGQESTVYDNATNKDPGGHLSGYFVTASSGLAAAQIAVYIYARLNDAGPKYPDVLDGTNSAETMTTAAIRSAGMVLVAVIDTDTTASREYAFRKRDVAMFFDGIMPEYWGVFVTQSTGQNLASGAIYFKPYYLT